MGFVIRWVSQGPVPLARTATRSRLGATTRRTHTESAPQVRRIGPSKTAAVGHRSRPGDRPSWAQRCLDECVEIW